MTSFAVCTPSRGTIFEVTVEGIERNRAEARAAGHEDLGWCTSRDLPIPDCHNAVAEKALATGADVLWFVEEDNIAPPGALLSLLALLETCTIAALDYPVWTPTGTWSCVCRVTATKAILYCGLGCTLVRRELFDTLPAPWFDSSAHINIVRVGDTTVLVPQTSDNPTKYNYGGQDIYFCHRAVQAGFTIRELEGQTCGHARLVKEGREKTNHGTHTIETIDRIEHWQQV